MLKDNILYKFEKSDVETDDKRSIEMGLKFTTLGSIVIFSAVALLIVKLLR